MSEAVQPYQVYKSLVQKVMLDPEQLPSLPAVTIKIRSAVQDDDNSNEDLAQICAQDPAFTTLLMVTVSSPIYAQISAPKTLSEAVGLLGRPKLSALSMSYSVKSLFTLKQPAVKKIYSLVWERLQLKTSISMYLSQRLKKRLPEEVMLASLLSEVGTLSILSALKEEKTFPNNSIFYQLCREYSKAFGAVLLTKWQVGQEFIDVLKFCGRWNKINEGQADLLDIINLGLFSTVKILSPNNPLPEISGIPSFKKLLSPFNEVDNDGNLAIVSQNIDEIRSLTPMLS